MTDTKEKGWVKKEKQKSGDKAPPHTASFYRSRIKNMACYRSKDKEELKMPYNRKAFGVVISKLRVQKCLTQESLSGLAGIARSHLAALEAGEKTAKLDTVWRIAEALGIAPSELIRRTEREGQNEKKKQSGQVEQTDADNRFQE